MPTLAEQWDAALAAQPGDWSHLYCELRLADSSRMEDTVVICAPLNPWRQDDDYRSGVLRFQAARTTGYGTAWQVVARRMAQLDERGVEGELRVLRSVDAASLVATQGPI